MAENVWWKSHNKYYYNLVLLFDLRNIHLPQFDYLCRFIKYILHTLLFRPTNNINICVLICKNLTNCLS